ncbi:MAG TPA: hypothetical protein VFK68_11445 [Propionibacteriaceae bacterium]|nr:hypothetical protein [Propionibacteriaceae bacterium]
MSGQPFTQGGTQQSELGALLAGTVRAVVDAQDVLDDHARQLAAEYAAAEPGTLALPPLWYAFDAVGIDIDLSTEVVRVSAGPGQAPQTQLVCRTLNPVTAGVFGYSAATGTHVHVTLTPQRVAPVPLPSSPPPHDGEPT